MSQRRPTNQRGNGTEVDCKSTGLRGKSVLVTRPAPAFGQPDNLVELLSKAGMKVILHPVMELSGYGNEPGSEQILGRMQEFNSLVFVSANGVRFFLRLISRLSVAPNQIFDSVRTAAIGPGTARALLDNDIQVDLVPEAFNSHALANSLVGKLTEPYLLIRADRGSDELARMLSDAGRSFEELVVYESRDVELARPDTVRMLNRSEIDWVTMTSPAIARSTVRLFGNGLSNSKIISISRHVSEVAKAMGFAVAAEAVESNFESMLIAMENFGTGGAKSN